VLNILQVSTLDRGGGAEAIADRLRLACKERGFGGYMAVGTSAKNIEGVRGIPRQMPSNPWYRFWMATARSCGHFAGRVKGARWLRQKCLAASQPTRWVARRTGVEDFHHPGTWKLLELFAERQDLVHCHNLHGVYSIELQRGGYFDLRALPWLCRQVPVLLTLHDAWLFSGHCAHSFDCERWRTGCGECPRLDIYPAILRDATASNWRRKREILAKCRLRVATPSEWLMDKVRHSILQPAIIEARVIPNGVKRDVFCPGDRSAARCRLNLPEGSFIAMTAGTALKNNPWKDYAALQEAVLQLAENQSNQAIILLAVGSQAPSERHGRVEIRFIPFLDDPAQVAMHYQAADIFVHAAKADTFPTTVMEAMSCGLPVIASAVGGIPEQIVHGTTGMLVPPGDISALARAIATLADNAALRREMGDAATADAASRFDERDMCDRYCNWYEEICVRQPINTEATEVRNHD